MLVIWLKRETKNAEERENSDRNKPWITALHAPLCHKMSLPRTFHFAAYISRTFHCDTYPTLLPDTLSHSHPGPRCANNQRVLWINAFPLYTNILVCVVSIGVHIPRVVNLSWHLHVVASRSSFEAQSDSWFSASIGVVRKEFYTSKFLGLAPYIPTVRTCHTAFANSPPAKISRSRKS